jgi:hypothetical protein
MRCRVKVVACVCRCQGKVFAAEKMVAASGFYHRHCFRCCFCAQPLDSTSVCDGPDNKVRMESRIFH